jgi:glycerate-2-kinase
MTPTERARAIFLAGVRQVDPTPLVRRSLSLSGSMLTMRSREVGHTLDLAPFRRILVIGAGKATARMAAGLEQVLGDRISDGLIVVKYGHTEQTTRIRTLEAGHPVPDANGVAAARALLALVDQADAQTLVITLLSGGGSALLPLPWSDGAHSVTLGDVQATTAALLGCGATIREINTVRKHLSGIAGGRLAARMAARGATGVTLILSDVVGDRLESIASGPTVGDPSTFGEALEVVSRYGIGAALPAGVMGLLEAGARGEVAESPKPGAAIFGRITTLLLGTNADALRGSADFARTLGYQTMILSSQISGEAREVGRVCAGIARDVVARGNPLPAPACILLGGETTVTLRGDGKGGRNQELALAFLAEMREQPEAFVGVTFLSGGSDGNDGPTEAAGGVVSADMATNPAIPTAAIHAALARNDSWHFFHRFGGHLITGPTNTNVCDIQVMIIERAETGLAGWPEQPI